MNLVKRISIFMISLTILFFIGFSLIKNTYSLDTPVHKSFDDINFYKCIVETYNASKKTNFNYRNVAFSDIQLASITHLVCDGKDLSDIEKIKSIKGIEKLTGLKSLNLINNLLTELDLSKNPTLTTVYAYSNILTNINVDNLVNLKSLDVYDNQLSSIDLSKNISLEELWLDKNEFSEIDISNNVLLERLGIGNNKLVEIDLTKNINLVDLEVYNNNLKEIDLSNNVLLDWLLIFENELVELDISKNTLLWNIEASYNNLSKIVLGEGVVYLDVYDNNLKEIDISASPKIDYLDVSENELSSIDVSKNLELLNLYLCDNKIKEIDVSKNAKLEHLHICNNEISEIDVSGNINLECLEINDNNINSLDLNKNINLKYLYTTNNFLDVAYGYKGEIISVPQIVKFPEHLYKWLPNWVSDNEQIIKVNENGDVLALNVGNVNVNRTIEIEDEVELYASIDLDVNVIELTSDKYIIDDINGYIYVGTESEIENIKNNLKLSDDNIKLEIDEENMTLYVKYGEEVLKVFKLINIRVKTVNIIDNKIYLPKLMNREEFINDFIVDCDRIIIKVYQNDELITGIKTIMPDMSVKIFYDNMELDEFILDETFKLDDSLNIDEENKWILDIEAGTTVNDIINKIHTTGIINIKDNKENFLVDNDLVGTDSKVIIVLNKLSYEYSIVVAGDVDGDGELKLPDIMKIANYKYRNSSSLNGIYLKAADYDFNMNIDLSDIMKIANKVYKGGN